MSRLERATVKSLLINVILVHCQTSNCATKAGIDRVSLLNFFIDYKSRGCDRRLRNSRQNSEEPQMLARCLDTQTASEPVCSYCQARLPPDLKSSAS